MADLSEHYSYHRSSVVPDDDLYGWLLELIEGPDWHKQAACRGMSAALFYAEKSGNDSVQQVAVAKTVCAGCPVRAECLDAGLGEEHGIWGATTPRQRRRIRTQKKRLENTPFGAPVNGVPAKCGTDSGYFRHRRLQEEPCAPCKAAHSTYERSRYSEVNG